MPARSGGRHGVPETSPEALAVRPAHCPGPGGRNGSRAYVASHAGTCGQASREVNRADRVAGGHCWHRGRAHMRSDLRKHTGSSLLGHSMITKHALMLTCWHAKRLLGTYQVSPDRPGPRARRSRPGGYGESRVTWVAIWSNGPPACGWDGRKAKCQPYGHTAAEPPLT